MAGKAVADKAGKLALLLGKCLPTVEANAIKVCVTKMELDVNLNMYFRHNTHVMACDPGKKCKSGDVVLIQELPEKITRQITHQVVEIVYPMGDVVDPLTNKKVVTFQFRDDIVEKNKLYGENKKAFNYEKAPPRGRFEGTRDFTDKDTYKKFHEVAGTPQPYGV